jgi:hypothetical protein
MTLSESIPEYTVVKVDELDRRMRGGSRFRAFETSATVLLFGSLIWGGFFLYDLFSNTTRNIQEALSEVTESPFTSVDTVVNPAVLTDEGISEAVRVFRPGGGFRSKSGYEAALKSVAKAVNERGAGTLTNAQIALVKRAEAGLVKMGMIDKRDTVKVHPVDRAAGFVSRDKRYWAIVLGLMVVPALPVLGSMVKEVTVNE